MDPDILTAALLYAVVLVSVWLEADPVEGD